MKGTIETFAVPKIAMLLLERIFFSTMLALEKASKDRPVLEKQLLVKKCLKKVQEFITTHPFAKFYIEVLDSQTRDTENPLVVISFKNFTKTDREIHNYHILLDETYTDFEIYQESISGILILLKI